MMRDTYRVGNRVRNWYKIRILSLQEVKLKLMQEFLTVMVMDALLYKVIVESYDLDVEDLCIKYLA